MTGAFAVVAGAGALGFAGAGVGGALSNDPAAAVPQAGQKLAASGICLPQ